MHVRRAGVTAFFTICIAPSLLAQSVQTNSIKNDLHAGILHQYPLTGASEVPITTDIGIRAVGAYAATALQAQQWTAFGSKSGPHTLIPHLSHDRTVAIFHSTLPYAYGENVSFQMNTSIVGGTVVSDSVGFVTMVRAAPAEIPDFMLSEDTHSVKRTGIVQPLNIDDYVLPSMDVTVDDSATPGTIYLANFGFEPIPNDCFLFNLNEHGQIVRQQPLPTEWGLDFKRQPTGLETYYDIITGCYLGLDSNWNVIDTFRALNYGTDEHELLVLPDSSYALLGISMTTMNLGTLVKGGQDSVIILGNVIQKFDQDGNLVFQWRGIDHYNVIDSKYQDLTSTEIDFEHANSLAIDSEGNILLSNRHLCEISKIDGLTGNFIWRLGGAHNQFQLLGDSIWFSFQHAARWIPNGDLTIFDNSNYDTLTGGNGQWIQQSRACEYRIDTTAKTATLVWQYHHTPETWSEAMGYVERLPNGNTLISWGADTNVAITEVRPDHTTAFELAMHNGNVSYRAMKVVPDSIMSLSTSANVVESNASNGFEIVQDATGSFAANFSIENSEAVTLNLYDETGRAVEHLLGSQIQSPSEHSVPISLNGLASGPYECVLTRAGSIGVRTVYNLK